MAGGDDTRMGLDAAASWVQQTAAWGWRVVCGVWCDGRWGCDWVCGWVGVAGYARFVMVAADASCMVGADARVGGGSCGMGTPRVWGHSWWVVTPRAVDNAARVATLPLED